MFPDLSRLLHKCQTHINESFIIIKRFLIHGIVVFISDRMWIIPYHMMSILLFISYIQACKNSPDNQEKSEASIPVKVDPILINQLGAEHFGNVIYRRGIEGPRLDASGNRILEMPIQESALTQEVVPPSSEVFQNGACALDVNGDNIQEMIVGRSAGEQATDLLWYEEIQGQTQWQQHFIDRIARGLYDEGFHDIMPFESKTKQQRVLGVILSVNRKILYWYKVPVDATQPWDQHLIADLSDCGAACAQSGLVLGDIAGNGRQDIVCGNFWIKCPADPVVDSWKVYRYSNWDRRSTPVFPDIPEWVAKIRFGGMNQLDLGDMDGDGRLDIVATDAEIPDARVGVFCRDTLNPGNLWNITMIDSTIYCPHSLVVADVNHDKRPDVLVGEMTAGGWWFPKNPNPRLYLYLNMGHLKFRKFVLHEGWGVHMMRLAPENQENKIFVFAADEIQPWYEDMTTHVVGWTISPGK